MVNRVGVSRKDAVLERSSCVIVGLLGSCDADRDCDNSSNDEFVIEFDPVQLMDRTPLSVRDRVAVPDSACVRLRVRVLDSSIVPEGVNVDDSTDVKVVDGPLRDLDPLRWALLDPDAVGVSVVVIVSDALRKVTDRAMEEVTVTLIVLVPVMVLSGVPVGIVFVCEGVVVRAAAKTSNTSSTTHRGILTTCLVSWLMYY